MKRISRIPALLILSLSVAACDSFLDRQPDDQLTSKNVFDREESTWEYLVNVYSFVLRYAEDGGYDKNSFSIAASDETSCAYSGNRSFALWTHNQLTPLTTHAGYRTGTYSDQYKGIREATFFMQNVGSCPELTPAEKKIWSAEARFLRAYYYTELLKWYGPVIFNGDEVVDFNDPDLDKTDRAPWETIVNWVANEYDLAAADLPDSWGGHDLGRATKGAALAMKARLPICSMVSPLIKRHNDTSWSTLQRKPFFTCPVTPEPAK